MADSVSDSVTSLLGWLGSLFAQSAPSVTPPGASTWISKEPTPAVADAAERGGGLPGISQPRGLIDVMLYGLAQALETGEREGGQIGGQIGASSTSCCTASRKRSRRVSARGVK